MNAKKVWPEFAERLRADSGAFEQQLVDAMRAEVDVFARPLEGGFGRDVRSAVRASVTGLADILDGGSLSEAVVDVHRENGRREVRLGRPLDRLLAAYHAAQHAAWRTLAEDAAELSAPNVAALAEVLMRYFDRLTAAAAEGFAAETARRAGEAERRVDTLLALLIRLPAADPDVLLRAVEEHGWHPGDRVAAAIIRGPAADDRGRVAARLPRDALVGVHGDVLCALLPDPDAPGLRRTLDSLAQQRPLVLGPSLTWTEAGLSFRLAVRGADHVTPGSLYVCDERLLELWLAGEPLIGRRLAARELAPLSGESGPSRTKLLQTLGAYLDHHGHQGAMAHDLGLHPQTVRYRLSRLRALFGSALEDPQRRLALRLALMADDAGLPGRTPGRAGGAS